MNADFEEIKLQY